MNHVDHPEIISVEWCAGYMGIHLGLKRVLRGLRCIAACEIEAYAVANLVAKIEGGWLEPFPIWSDCWTFPSESFRGLVDIFIAGYPCQPFSFAGRRKGKRDKRHLWPAVREGIERMGPSAVFFENVEGHISLGLREVLRDLEALGYQATWGIFSTREVGGSQIRKRVFIYGQLANCPRSRLARLRIPAGSWAERQGTPYIEWAGKALGGTCSQQDLGKHTRGFLYQPGGTGEHVGNSLGARLGTGGIGGVQSASSAQAGDDVANSSSPRFNRGQVARTGGEDAGPVTGRRDESERGGEDVAQSMCQLRGEGRSNRMDGESSASGERYQDRCGELAQPESINPRGLSIGAGKEESGLGSHRHGVAGTVREGRQVRECGAEVHEPVIQLLPAFPPGPSDFSAWREVLAFDPTLEPAICSVAYGRTYRVDELRLAGNGVVPLCAAKAFVTLHRELNP